MHKILPLAVILALPMIATSATAADQTNAAKPAKEKKICRSDTATGSIMPKRTCHTASEWAEIDKANAATAKDALDRRYTGNIQLGSNGVSQADTLR